MFLAVDIGNTSTTLGFYEEAELRLTLHFPTLRNGTPLTDDTRKLLSDNVIESACIASVVPQATFPTRDVLSEMFPQATLRVLSHDDVPIKTNYRRPDEIGIDRILGSLAGYVRYAKPQGKPLIVIDFGTATVFDCVNDDGLYLGGAISLGIESSAAHLSTIAAQLPKIELVFPNHVLGRSTSESMRSGILYGAVAAAEGLVKKLSGEAFIGVAPVVVATGGLSALIKDHTAIIDHVEPFLVLEGIRLSV